MSLQKESVSEKLVKRDSEELRKNGEQLKAIRLQNKSEWEKEFVRRFVNTHGTHWRPLRGLWTEEVIEFIYEVISQRENEIAEEVPNALHEYARWILTDGKYATPLQRRSKKKEITLQLLKH